MSSHSDSEHGSPVAHRLEQGDGLVHYLVSILLLLLALCILGYGTYSFVTDLLGGLNPEHASAETLKPLAERFGEAAITLLSDLLFGVVVLELLSTILTYIKARNLEATIKDFLIVALISSIRKILLVGAQSSIEKSQTKIDFVNESWGTVISILGILLLIGGLLLLDHRAKAKRAEEAALAGAIHEEALEELS